MTAGIIDSTNIYSQPSINLFTILDNRSNIADPRDNTGARTFVYDSDPLHKSIDFNGFPYIVCEDATIQFPENKSADMKTQYLTWSQTITIRTVKDGSSGTRVDSGKTDMRSIVDNLIKTINSVTNKATLQGYGMFNVEVSLLSIDTPVINQRLTHQAVLEVVYSTRIAVSV